MIGHQVLLNSQDSTSRVLPIKKEGDRYRIEFDSEFEFTPDDLVTTINQVAEDTRIADRYIIEVEDCITKEIVYGWEMNHLEHSDIIPCRQRMLPKACYNLLFTLMESNIEIAVVSDIEDIASIESSAQKSQGNYGMLVLMLGLLIGGGFVLKKNIRKSDNDPNLIQLGDFQFDKRNSELMYQHQKVELTGKEADLLLLLYNAVNTTVEREVILSKVWGTEGDYIGRTLDVFISKLRKKLGADPRMKIVNIRGVGYKLVMNV
ncbi:MAG: winged helix-turn-helix domain-containing protein [Bacteroidia bacterium]|nr:winged helix-turn-helix domain-containing protein [Bacteroidia bacterium]